MRGLFAVGLLGVLGLLTWRIARELQSDWVTMALGCVFGLASALVSTWFILFTSTLGRYREEQEDNDYWQRIYEEDETP